MSPKKVYEQALKDLGGKDDARSDKPWEFAKIKREYAQTMNNGAPQQAMLKLADTIEAEARAAKIPEPRGH